MSQKTGVFVLVRFDILQVEQTHLHLQRVSLVLGVVGRIPFSTRHPLMSGGCKRQTARNFLNCRTIPSVPAKKTLRTEHYHECLLP